MEAAPAGTDLFHCKITSRLGKRGSGVLEASFANFSSTNLLCATKRTDTPVVELGNYRWSITIGVQRAVGTDYLSAYSKSANPGTVNVVGRMCLIDRDGTEQPRANYPHSAVQPDQETGMEQVIPLASLKLPDSCFLVNGTFHIRVVIDSAYSLPPVWSTCAGDSQYVYFGCEPTSFVTDGDVFPCDFRIRSAVEEVTDKAEEIAAHKYVLALRSPVFRAMLKAGMKEAATNTIEITDFAEPVVRAFVRFLYENRCACEVLKAHHLQLLAMADKYQVPELSEVCCHYLITALSVDNVLELLVLTSADFSRCARRPVPGCGKRADGEGVVRYPRRPSSLNFLADINDVNCASWLLQH
jgi:hypothetical protein